MKQFWISFAMLVVGQLVLGCAPTKPAPPLTIPAVDPLMARKVTIDKKYKDMIVFSGAEADRSNGYAVTVKILNRFDKAQRGIVRWEWFDSTGMKLSPGRNDKPQTLEFAGRKEVPISSTGPQPGVEDWKLYITMPGK